jgi:hypothetical protein
MKVKVKSFLFKLDGGECSIRIYNCVIPSIKSQNPLNRKLGGPQSLVGRFSRKEKFSPVGIRNPDHPTRIIVAVPTIISPLPA